MKKKKQLKLQDKKQGNPVTLPPRTDRSLRMIDALMDDELSPELRTRMQKLFRGSVDDPNLQEAFHVYAERFEPAEEPLTGDSLMRYNLLAKRLDLPLKSEEIYTARPVVKPRRNLSILWRVAAVIIPAALILTGLFLGKGRSDDNQMILIATTDSVKAVRLADGSHITLYENSTLSYSVDYPASRSVSLDGKARFDVARLEDNPFVVTGNSFSVTVLGTEFYMISTSADPISEVSLLSGVVSIDGEGFGEFTITPGQQFYFDSTNDTYKVKDLTEGNILRLLDKGIEFSGRPLGEVIELLADYFEVKAEIVPDIDLNVPIRIKLDKGITAQEAFHVIGLASGLFDYSLFGDTVRIEMKK